MLIALYAALFLGGAGPAVTVDAFLVETKTAVVRIVEDAGREQRVVNVIEGLDRSVVSFREQRVVVSKTLEAVDAEYTSRPDNYMDAVKEMEKVWLDFEFEMTKSHIEVTSFLTEEEWDKLFDHLKRFRKGKS